MSYKTSQIQALQRSDKMFRGTFHYYRLPKQSFVFGEELGLLIQHAALGTGINIYRNQIHQLEAGLVEEVNYAIREHLLL